MYLTDGIGSLPAPAKARIWSKRENIDKLALDTKK